MGAGVKYDKNTFPLLAEKYARKGLSDKQIATNLGICPQSYYTYQKKHVEFLEAIKRGKSPVDIQVENAVLKRALGYTYEEKQTEFELDAKGVPSPKRVKITKKEVIPDLGSAAFWLKNRNSKEWKDKQDVNFTDDRKIVADLFPKDIEEKDKDFDGTEDK